MAYSQVMAMDDGHINEKINETDPQFYYSEEQRAALEELLKNGDGAFKDRLKEDNVKDFLSAREIKSVRSTFQEYCTDNEDDFDSAPAPTAKADSGIHSTYWPELSDVEVPPLDIGWPDLGVYKGVTRVTVHSNPPKEDSPRIKLVVRKLIQESRRVVAVVMDLLTDLQILQDMLDAASKRNVAIYIVLDAGGIPHFLDMFTRLQVTAVHLEHMRVRTVRGFGMPLSFGKLPGSLGSKYMLVDGNKVMFGTYSFTWMSSRVDRNTVLVMTGHVVDMFDRDFRELYAISDNMDLYRELNIAKPPKPAPTQIKVQPTNRFKVGMGDPLDVGTNVPAHKFYNPKYALVVGGSLKDVGNKKESQAEPDVEIPRAISDRPDRLSVLVASPTDVVPKEGSQTPNGLISPSKKLSFLGSLKIKSDNPNDHDDSTAGSSPASPALCKSPKLSPTCLPMDEDKEPPKGSRQINAIFRNFSKVRMSFPPGLDTQEEDDLKAQKRPEKKDCILS